VDATPDSIQRNVATGVAFENPSAPELLAAVRRAHALYRQPIAWRRMQKCAMRQDFSWRRSAAAYADLYRSLAHVPVAKKPAQEVVAERLTA